MDYKAFAKAMRENKVIDENGNIICSDTLWEEIAKIIESISNTELSINEINGINTYGL